MAVLVLILNIVLAVLVIAGVMSGPAFAWVYLIELTVLALVYSLAD